LSAVVGKETRFDGSGSSDPGRRQIDLFWNFGDGATRKARWSLMPTQKAERIKLRLTWMIIPERPAAVILLRSKGMSTKVRCDYKGEVKQIGVRRPDVRKSGVREQKTEVRRQKTESKLGPPRMINITRGPLFLHKKQAQAQVPGHQVTSICRVTCDVVTCDFVIL